MSGMNKGATEMGNRKNNLLIATGIFILCLLVHTVEVIFIRTDETVFAECFINKVFGIVLLFVVLKLMHGVLALRSRTQTDLQQHTGIQGSTPDSRVCMFCIPDRIDL